MQSVENQYMVRHIQLMAWINFSLTLAFFAPHIIVRQKKDFLMAKWSIQGATVVTPDKVIERGNVLIDGDEISEVSPRPVKSSITTIIESGVLCPGLINSHDHLIGNYFPKVGNGPYMNWLPWDNDLKSADVYHERQLVNGFDIPLLAGYRNLLSGVTSVSDHIPHFVNEPYIDILPMKVMTRYALMHSVSDGALPWGEGFSEEFQKAIKDDSPLVIHCSEGFDDETKRNVATLERLGVLDDHTVLVHGIAFSKTDIDLLKQRNVNVVWCADSNVFMFNKTTNIKGLLEKGVNVSIGTDSPMSGGLTLLTELKFDRDFYRKEYKEDLSAKQIVKMVTSNAAKAFRLYKNGKIDRGFLADLVLFDDKGDPFESIVNAESKDVRLVVIDGLPVYGDASFASLFDDLGVEYQRIKVQKKDKIVVGDLLGLLKRISRAVGFKKEFPFLPVDFDYQANE
jgi:cytosine/adenosine deaminase-related metal-dependent hydrolase